MAICKSKIGMLVTSMDWLCEPRRRRLPLFCNCIFFDESIRRCRSAVVSGVDSSAVVDMTVVDLAPAVVLAAIY